MVTWAAGLEAVSSVITPVAVAAVGFVLSRRLKELEHQQWRNQELIKARLDYYRQLSGPLNDLLCYFAFIGSWKEQTPPQVIAAKRSLDKLFHIALPIFSANASNAYEHFMDLCFETFGDWGKDALLKTGCTRRRNAFGPGWQADWDDFFAVPTGQEVPQESLRVIRDAYNAVLAALVEEVGLTAPRTDYSTTRLVLNAH